MGTGNSGTGATLTESTDNLVEPITLGKVVGVFGVNGWVKLFSYTEPREAILDYASFLLGNGGQWNAAKWVEGKRHGKNVIVRLEGVSDRDSAAALIGQEIRIRRDDMPEAGEGQYYWSDLQGLSVVHKDGTTLGEVEHMLATGAHDVMVVKGDQEILIPFVLGNTILDVDVTKGVIQVDWEWL